MGDPSVSNRPRTLAFTRSDLAQRPAFGQT